MISHARLAAPALLCLAAVTSVSNGQTMVYSQPKSISVRGTFGNAAGGSNGTFLTDNDLSDGYDSGADSFGGPAIPAPSGPTASAFFQSGEASSSGAHADALWYSPYYNGSVAPEQVFTLGLLHFRNGSITAGTGATSVDLNFTLALPGISLPYGLNPIVFTETLNLAGTGESGGLLLLSDTLFPTSYTDGAGNPYFLQLSFSDTASSNATGPLPASAREFCVAEGTTAGTAIYGKFATGAVPEPAAALLGAIGSLLLLRRRK